MSGIINIATKAVYLAANIIQQLQRSHQYNFTQKSNKENLITTYNNDARNIIVSTIKRAYPNHNILVKNHNLEDNNSNFTWVINPIDGEANFIHNNPQYCISIALTDNNIVTHSVVFDPNSNNIYTAELGKGAFVGNRRLRISKINYLEDALIATHYADYDKEMLDSHFAITKDVILNTMGLRYMGSVGLNLAYVAAGYIDGFWAAKLKLWDITAGVLLVKESGGILHDFTNTQNFWQNGNIIAANAKIAPEILKIIQQHL